MKYSLHTRRNTLMIFVTLCLLIILWGCKKGENHDGHDHSEHSPKEHIEEIVDYSRDEHTEDGHIEEDIDDHSEHDDKEDDHSGHGHSENADDNHENELIVELSEQAQNLAEIRLGQVKMSKIGATLELLGEIAFIDDKVAHITPRYAGIAKEVLKPLGEQVNKGDVLAVIE